MKLRKIEGHQDLVKDEETGAVLNINTHEIEAAKKRKLARIEQKKREESLIKDVDDLKKDMSEIKDLLKKIVEG